MARWGIAEWYGRDIVALTPEERRGFADIAIASEDEGVPLVDQPICPFMSTLIENSRCNKAGGVCSIRPYVGDKPLPKEQYQPATTCPNRFLEQDNGKTLFSAISEKVVGVNGQVKVVKEVPFLHKMNAEGNVRGAKAGRIDWVIIPDPFEVDTGSFDWIAVETQSVYFSGVKFRPEFELYRSEPERLHGPLGARRPDFRSSGAKRLVPQLETKSPVMRRWGKKVVVVIDRAFADEFSTISKISEDFDNAEVAIYIVKFDERWNLRFDQLILTELDAAKEAIQATAAVRRDEFENGLREQLALGRTGKIHDA